MAKKRLLYLSSNHAAITPGGLESYTLDLYNTIRESDEFEPIFLARAGSPFTGHFYYHGWSPFVILENDPNQYLFYTDTYIELGLYDHLYGRWEHKEVLTRFFRDFLLAHRPDIVHLQHLNFLGYDLVRVVKNTLPDVPIVFTLHEYGSICHRDGQMVRTFNSELCHEESPQRCNECFPDISPQDFFMRKQFIQSHLKLVDHFIAPTDYVRDRYVDWGIPAGSIQVEPQGMMPVTDQVPEEATSRPRNRFAFFGQLNQYKGADVLLDAMGILGEDFEGHLWLHGANFEIQPIEFREAVEARLRDSRENVTFAGPYKRSDLGKLMANVDWVIVPSIWWETGPLVVMEAFQYGRPVICSDIGGMSKRVTDGVNGMHFKRRDAEDLARKMQRAAETPGLWDEFRAGIPPAPPRLMEDHAKILIDVYERLLAGGIDQPASVEAKEAARA